MQRSYRILLVDDHQIMLDGLETMLSNVPDFQVAAHANTGAEAVKACELLQPDVLLMDLDMPEMNGIEASQKIKKAYPLIKIIILSLHAEKSIIQKMMALGVDGYLIKTSKKSEVLDALRRVLAGEKYFSADVAFSLSGLGTQPGGLSSEAEQQQLSNLSYREQEVLKLIAEGFTTKEIGIRLFLSPRTIDAHRSNIMNKLDIHKVTGLVRFALKAGLVD